MYGLYGEKTYQRCLQCGNYQKVYIVDLKNVVIIKNDNELEGWKMLNKVYTIIIDM